ncbi:Uncharacterised protein [BD1-7 clade bacterium]|uniref:DUF2029 domain-containing protein n=1 Tax=BD1-7 clade bacterium TaxID=2029982 RepID=A0A5S9N541_9GAMM|nr:Uncharacterised protein [BD1-7 clade bacterium]
MSSWRNMGFAASLVFALTSTVAAYVLAEQAAIAAANVGTATVLQYAVMTIAVLLAIATYQPDHKHQQVALITVAVICRLLLIPVDAYTSNDIARYLFDGKLALEGFDPYSIRHDATVLDSLRAIWQPPAEHVQYVTLYPPLALGLFSLAASSGVTSAVWIWKAMAAIAGITTVFTAQKLLHLTGRQRYLPVIALSPLLILETGVGGHLDAFSTLAIALALLALFRKKPVLAGMCIGAGTLLKLLPLAILLPAFFQCRHHKERLHITAATLITVAIGYASIIAMGMRPIGSIGVFFAKWRFGSPTFETLHWLFQGDYLTPVLLAIFAVGCLWIAFDAWRHRLSPQQEWHHADLIPWQTALALPLLLSPVVFPWYLMPLALLSAFALRGWLLAWISLMPLTYEVLNHFIDAGHWQPATWPLWVIGLGVQLALVIELVIKPRCDCKFHPQNNKGMVCSHW